ncbi:MAG: PAS domain-containing protein [Nitrospirales bacterium]|nr:PAS domain-containing protein [Nitrospirales bacterium]
MEFFEAVINNLDEAIYLFDKRGRLIFANKAGEEFFGKSLKEIRHRQFQDLFSTSKDLVVLLQKSLREGRSFNCRDLEVELGRAVNVEVNVSPFYLAAALEGALLCLRENLSITTREDFHFDMLLYLIGSVAHEIKNPLSGIKGAAQILKGSARSEEAMECVNLILKEADRLNLVLNSYLTMTRTPVFNELNIHEVIEHALKVMNSTAGEKDIRVHKSYDPSLPSLLGDESKLLQVFINLLKNAVEAMEARDPQESPPKKQCAGHPFPEGEGLHVLSISTRPSNEYMVIYEGGDGLSRREARSKKQRWVVITVQDTGIGIPREELGRIFLPFYTKKAGGSGLGLALSKKIIKDHGGIIKVKSEKGCGTVFSIYLPLRAAGEGSS